jgi:TRAP-type C4-dicarboxylate transport system permease small subunit
MDKSRLSRLCRLLFRQLPLGLSAALLTIGVTINFINAVGRYGFDAAIFWAEEAMVYLAIWAIFLAAIAVAYDRAELAMDFFSASLSKRWKRIADAGMTTVTVVVCLFMATQSMTLLRTLIRNGQNSVALEVPMAIPQASLTFGFVMIAGAVIARFFLNSDSESRPFEEDRVETTS